MNNFARGPVAGIALIAAAIGLAASAGAEPPSGTFTATVTSDTFQVPTPIGRTFPLVFSPCGPDCLHMADPGNPKADKDLRLQGDVWTTFDAALGCTTTLNSALTLTYDCGVHGVKLYQLAQSG